MGKISNDDDLGLDLAGGRWALMLGRLWISGGARHGDYWSSSRDDPVCPGENPIYIASISKGSVVEGKLKVNDCILRVNNIDCRDVDRGTIISTLRGAGRWFTAKICHSGRSHCKLSSTALSHYLFINPFFISCIYVSYTYPHLSCYKIFPQKLSVCLTCCAP